jgi:hypothetical protein
MHILFSILAIVGATLTGFLYWLGLDQSLLFYYPWFDTPLHLAGGLTIGLWGFSLAWRRNYSSFQAFVFILLLALSVGLVWELFEYLSGLTAGKPGYWLDTFGDLGNDVAGAIIPWFFYWVLQVRRHSKI